MKNAKKIIHNPQLLLERISNTFPDLKWSEYTFINEGWDHDVLILDGKYVFRFPNDEEYREGLETEITLLRMLKPLTSVTIPQYTFIAPDTSFAGYEIVAGKKLSEAFFHTLRDEVKTTIAKQLANLLSVMHTFLISHNIEINTPAFDSDQNQIKEYLHTRVREKLTDQDFNIAQKILDEVDSLLVNPVPSVLVHGDIYSQHLWWDTEEKQLGVIDFSDACKSDPAFDFSEIHEYGVDFVKEVYIYYTGPKDDTFLDRALVYQKWAGVNMMADHFINFKTSFEEARETFDRTKNLP